jgi:1-acyl-sn-glycerol-3-phosphate acyltransferase
MPRHPLRALIRLVGFLVIVVVAVLEYGLRLVVVGRARDVRGRAAWLHRWTGRALRWLGITLRLEGTPPGGGLLASNHLGYLDVFVLSAAAPVVFVSREDVARWPLAGALTKMAGTVFIDRARRADVMRVGEAIVPIVEAGQPVSLFLEGTSTGGDRVLPFHSSLLAPAVRRGWTVTPVHLEYVAPDAAADRELCYWGEAVFLPHFLNLLGLRRAEARVRFGAPLVAEGDRRELATRLRRAVCALGGRPE